MALCLSRTTRCTKDSSCIDDWTNIAIEPGCQAEFSDASHRRNAWVRPFGSSRLKIGSVLQSRRIKTMLEALPIAEAVLEVISNDGAKRYVRVTQTPFLMGRGAETGNHLQLNDRRISRNCAAIVMEANRLYIEDRGQRRGVFINNEKIESRALEDGDIITFGLEDSYEIIYRSAPDSAGESIPNILTRIEHITSSEPASGGLRKLNMLLEASSLLHSQLP